MLHHDIRHRIVRKCPLHPEWQAIRRGQFTLLGRYDVRGHPLLTGHAEYIDAFRAYLSALAERGVTQISAPELPDDPVTLSYLVGASMIIDLSDRQTLLAEPDALHRLVAERTLLSRELTMLRALTATPAPDLRNSPYSSN